MVKQAEKIRKRNPFLPVIGLLIGGGLAVVAALLIEPLLTLLPELRTALLSTGSNYNYMRFAIGGVLWLVLCGIAYFLVAVLAGNDPSSAKNMPMRPRNAKKRN
jgi:hypothetical protein